MTKKKVLLAMLTILSSAFVCKSAGWGGGNERNDNWKGEGKGRALGHASRPRVVIKMRNYSVPHANPIQNPQHIVRDNHHVTLPQRDDRGAPILQRRSTWPPAHHTAIINNRPLVQNIVQRERVEIVPNRYYWHREGGVRYCHYYEDGIHWYGFYHGPTFYWTRYYGNRWWWFDVGFDRWVFWWGGYWWWQAPEGGMYVYVQNTYYPYEAGVVTVANPEIQPAPAAIPAPAEGNTWLSPDGTRMVQIYGTDSEAFLYDKTVARPAYMDYLGKNVLQIRFSGGTEGRPLRILVDFKDGSFAIFNNNGISIDSPSAGAEPATAATAAQSEAAPPAAPPTPEEMPPMPTSAPGEGAPPAVAQTQ